MTIEIGPTQASVPYVTTLIFFTIQKMKESDCSDLIKIMADVFPQTLRSAFSSSDRSSDYLKD